MSDGTQPAMAYPTSQQYERWKSRAEELDMSVSEFMQAMIEAGMKKFDVTVAPDETARELRRQRNGLKEELDSARNRIQQLERRLHQEEGDVIVRYVAENPGASYQDIAKHVVETAPQWVNDHLDTMEGERVRQAQDGYYPIERTVSQEGDEYDSTN